MITVQSKSLPSQNKKVTAVAAAAGSDCRNEEGTNPEGVEMNGGPVNEAEEWPGQSPL